MIKINVWKKAKTSSSHENPHVISHNKHEDFFGQKQFLIHAISLLHNSNKLVTNLSLYLF